MNTVADIIRSILVGQTIWAAIWSGVVFYIVYKLKLRPGFLLGISFTAIGNFAGIVYVLISTLQRFNEPVNWRTVTAALAILAESLGCVLIAAHLFFHDPEIVERTRRWFHGE